MDELILRPRALQLLNTEVEAEQWLAEADAALKEAADAIIKLEEK